MKELKGEQNMTAKSTLALLTLLVVVGLVAAQAQTAKYPPVEQYLISQADEIALAKTAAPANISDHATIKVLTRSGFEVAQQGDNGSVCMVMRGFSAPTGAIVATKPIDPANHSLFIFRSSNLAYRFADIHRSRLDIGACFYLRGDAPPYQ